VTSPTINIHVNIRFLIKLSSFINKCEIVTTDNYLDRPDKIIVYKIFLLQYKQKRTKLIKNAITLISLSDIILATLTPNVRRKLINQIYLFSNLIKLISCH